MFTCDTNILIYSIDHREPAKQAIAEHLIAEQTLQRSPFPLQTLSEFYFATTRKKLLRAAEASGVVSDILETCGVLSAIDIDLKQAMALHQTDAISFFDALVLATAARSGCNTFFSEDFQHNRAYGSITVRNPFLLTPAELDTLL